MNDFDFDELDRAVTSVLSKTKSDDSQQTTGAVSPSQTDTLSPAGIAPAVVAPKDQAISSTPVVSTDYHEHAAVSQASTAPAAFTAGEGAAQGTSAGVSTPSEPVGSHEVDAPTIDLTPLALEDIPTSETPLDHPVLNPEVAPVSSPEPTAEGLVVPGTAMTEQHSPAEVAPADHTSDPATIGETTNSVIPQIPPRRGRFMDVMSPAATPTPNERPPMKHAPARALVTLRPSDNFVASSVATHETETAPDRAAPEHDIPVAPEETLPVIPVVAEKGEAETIPSAVGDTSEDSTVSEQATPPETTLVQTPIDGSPAADASTLSTVPLEVEETSSPFIPDVSVDKRPLNTLPTTTPELGPATSDPKPEGKAEAPEIQPVDSPSAAAPNNVPKEFNEDIMAVEANETVGTVSAPEGSSASAPAVAVTTEMNHPMFDTSSLGPQTNATAVKPASKLSWVIIGALLFLVGAVLGVLYFLYGQG